MAKRIDPVIKPDAKIRKFWITTPNIRGEVHVNARGLICHAPPTWSRLLRQPLFALTGWLRNNGSIQIEELKEEKEK